MSRERTVLGILTLAICTLSLFSSSISAADPVPDYIGEVSYDNLVNVATDLVTLYGPRQEDAFSPYSDDSCTLNTAIVYPKSNVEMSTDYVRDLFEDMGYPPASITMEEVTKGAGHNVYVTKVGSEYPNVFIEFSAHIDSVPQTPGGNDNASGSTAVVELARVLKDYPNRYSMRFILWVGEEFDTDRGTAYYGSAYHLQQAVARGEEFKAGIVLDHIGWPYPGDPTGLLNGVSYNNAESERIADMFDQVRTDYNIQIGFDKVNQIFNSDEHSYWDLGFTAVSSGGGWLYYRPNYHDCGDTTDNIDFTNVLRTTQQNLAVGLRLDEEIYTPSGTPTGTPATSPTATTLPGTPTNTPTTPVPTATDVPPTGFPSTIILDNFDRADGALGANWSGNTAGHNIASNQLVVGSGQDFYWNASSFGADQEVYVTLANINPNSTEIDLILKSQSSNDFTPGLIEVVYDPGAQRIQVWTYAEDQNWVQRGGNVSVEYINGDQFGARAAADGTVEVYKNGIATGNWDVSAWTYSANGGYVGLWPINAANTVLDDFGGGTMGATAQPTSTPTDTAVPPTATPAVATPTTTNTPIPGATNTPTNTPLPPTATATSTPASGFPSANILDDFNRPDGDLGANWGGLTVGYSVASNQLDVGTGDRLLWQAAPFGADQEAYVTFSAIDPSAGEQDLLLKSQNGTNWESGVLEVLYNPSNSVVQVWTYSPGQTWQKWGADIPVTFEDGDQFGARALSNGMVSVYRNGNLLQSRDVSGWQFAANGGYIGLWYYNADNAFADNFGGGMVVVGPISTTTPTSIPTNTPVPPTATNTPTNTPLPPTATNTPTNTPLPPTATNTPTNTPLPPTTTNTPTNTPLPPTATNTPTNTPLPPTATNTPTNTPLPPTATNTPTNTPLPPTATNTPTNTPLPPTATNTPTPPATSPNLLDDFNQTGDVMRENWGGHTAGYSIVLNQLDVGIGDRILWQTEQFGSDQEVFITLTNIDQVGSEHDLLLKSQSPTTWLSGVIEVMYDAKLKRVQIYTYDPDSPRWVKRGSTISVEFQNGDQFSAIAKADGTVEVYRNGVLIGTRSVGSWPYASGGGYIGLWFESAENALVDDFGGGTIGVAPN